MKSAFGLAASLWLSVTMATASAGPILWVCDDEGKIGTVDVASGKVTVVGDAGVVLTDIAFDPEGRLFGVSFSYFYRIDGTTGAATSIGSLGPAGINALVFSTTGTAYAMGIGGDDLYRINTRTGAAKSIGRVRHGGSLGDLAFHDGKLYLASSSKGLVRVDLSPVGGTAIGQFGVASVYGLAHGDDGVLYAVAGTSIYSVNPETGAATFVVDYGGKGLGDANGAAFAHEGSRYYHRTNLQDGKGSEHRDKSADGPPSRR